MQKRNQLFLPLFRIDNHSAVLLQSMSHVRALQQSVVHYHHIIGIINIGMYCNRLGADTVVSRNRRSHPLRTIFREALHVLSRLECHICQQKSRRLRSLSASAMPSDFHCVFHICSCLRVPAHAFICLPFRFPIPFCFRRSAFSCPLRGPHATSRVTFPFPLPGPHAISVSNVHMLACA